MARITLQLPKFHLHDKDAGQEWTWTQLAGVDTTFNKIMNITETAVFSDMLRKQQHSRFEGSQAYLITDFRHE